MKLVTVLTQFTKINSRWITDLNAKGKTVRLLKDNTGENLGDYGWRSLDGQGGGR